MSEEEILKEINRELKEGIDYPYVEQLLNRLLEIRKKDVRFKLESVI